jgi:hypothetical protein
MTAHPEIVGINRRVAGDARTLQGEENSESILGSNLLFAIDMLHPR